MKTLRSLPLVAILMAGGLVFGLCWIWAGGVQGAQASTTNLGATTCPAPSTGQEGPFAPTQSTILQPGVHNFTTINIPAGVTVRTIGTGVLDLRATGNVQIDGNIDLSGGHGGDGSLTGCEGGTTGNPSPARCYGQDGGAGGSGGITGLGGTGTGTGAGRGGNYGGGGGGISGGGGGGGNWGGGGGAGGNSPNIYGPSGYLFGGQGGGDSGGTAGNYASSGGGGGRVSSGPPYSGVNGQAGGSLQGGGGGGGSIGGTAAHDLAMNYSSFGPGGAGGGGGGVPGAMGGGGGGGGGALRILSASQLTINGNLLTKGGHGGDGFYNNNGFHTGGGGGGSGGAIFLAAPSTTLGPNAIVNTVGGNGGSEGPAGTGGAGGLGRIVLATNARSGPDHFIPPLPPGDNGPGYTYLAGYCLNTPTPSSTATSTPRVPTATLTGTAVPPTTTSAASNTSTRTAVPASATATRTVRPVSSSTATRTPVGEPTQVIYNPGFETGRLSGWAYFELGQGSGWARVTNRAHTGRYGAEMEARDPLYPSQAVGISQNVAVPQAGGTLRFWFWTDPRDTANTHAIIINGTITPLSMSGEWQQYSVDMGQYRSTTVVVAFIVRFGHMGVDDVELWSPAPPTTPTAVVTDTPTSTSTATTTLTGTPLMPTATSTGTFAPTSTSTSTSTGTPTSTPLPPTSTGTPTGTSVSTDTATSTATSTPAAAFTVTETATAIATVTPACQAGWQVVSSLNVNRDHTFVYGIAVVSSGDIWSVGEGDSQALVEHWDGSQYSVVTAPSPGDFSDALYAASAVSSNDVWAVGSMRSFSGEAHSLIEHWNGTYWAVVPSPDPPTAGFQLTGVKAISSSDVWAVGPGTLTEHWDGSSWRIVPSPNAGTGSNLLYAITGSASNDLWAVGGYFTDIYDQVSHPLTMHWDGTTWTLVSAQDNNPTDNLFSGVTSLGPNNVWAVGMSDIQATSRTLIEHWDGSTWSVVSSPNPNAFNINLKSVAAVSASDIWAVGSPGLIEHWDGSTWNIVTDPVNADMSGVAALPTGGVWSAGMGLFGAEMRTVIERSDSCPVPSPTAGSTNTSTPNATATGTAPVPTATSTRMSTPTGIATGSATNTPSLPTSTGTSLSTGTPTVTATASVTPACQAGWQRIDSPSPDQQTNELSAIDAVSGSDVWAVGVQGNRTIAEHWNGAQWSVITTQNPADVTDQFHDVTALSANDVWAVGEAYTTGLGDHALIEHWNGTVWSVVPAATPQGSSWEILMGAASAGPNSVWAVGYASYGGVYHTIIEHWNGTQWAISTDISANNPGTLNAVSAVSDNDAWAVGVTGQDGNGNTHLLTLHWNGSAWNEVTNPSPSVWHDLKAVTALSSSDVWAVGYTQEPGSNAVSFAEHWDGNSWNMVSSPNPQPGVDNGFEGIAAVSSTDIWAVGTIEGGAQPPLTEHWDGNQWTAVSASANNGALIGATYAPGGAVWAVGLRGIDNHELNLIERYITCP